MAREGVLLFSLFLLLATVLALPAYAQEALWTELDAKTYALYQQGRYAEGVKVAQEALKVAEESFGPHHPNLATSLNNLANLYQAQGQYAAAEPLLKRALAIYEKALGPSHPWVATSLNNLAELYRVQGKYAAAEQLYQRALTIKEKALGPDHPQVALTLNSLAVLYEAQGQYAAAAPLPAEAKEPGKMHRIGYLSNATLAARLALVGPPERHPESPVGSGDAAQGNDPNAPRSLDFSGAT